MYAKPVFVVTALMLATIGVSVGEIPNLLGNWTGSYEGYEQGTGYINYTGASMTVSEQKGRLFTGNFSDQEQWKEGFSGIIALDNKTLYIAEYDHMGYAIGTIISNDMIELDYLEDGEPAGAFIDKFQRVK